MKTVNPAKPWVQKIYVYKKSLCTQNCHHRFIKNLLPEKCKENMYTKQPRFKSWLKKYQSIFRFICSLSPASCFYQCKINSYNDFWFGGYHLNTYNSSKATTKNSSNC